jgi:hypothetical protein
MRVCKFCKKALSTASSLNNHQKTAKYCLKIQNKEAEKEYGCPGCKKIFSQKAHLDRHSLSCSASDTVEEHKKIKDDFEALKQQLDNAERRIRILSDCIYTKDSVIKKFMEQDAAYATRDTKTVIEIRKPPKSQKCDPLGLDGDLTIDYREEDGYINVTNLCKAGGKEFKHWKANARSKAFLKVLSSSVGIPTSELIRFESGSNTNRGTWTHPQVAINIAQWLSPQFDMKVSAWVYEIMMSGTIDITATKSYRDLQQENYGRQLRISYLEKKYLKRHDRVQYEERNVIYMITTPYLKQERRYILGKATNLTNRLSVYNKTDEHTVVYYQACSNEDIMNVVEGMVFQKLSEYRECANRERFILPENRDETLFSNAINECVSFYSS